MAKKAITPEKFVVDHSVHIPEGLESVVYDKDIDLQAAEGTGEETSNEGGAAGELPIPNDLIVVDQTLRTKPNGQEVVDIIVEVPDVPGITQYDLHVTKI